MLNLDQISFLRIHYSPTGDVTGSKVWMGGMRLDDEALELNSEATEMLVGTLTRSGYVTDYRTEAERIEAGEEFDEQDQTGS